MVICLEWGADLHMAQLMPLLLTVCCFSKVQMGFTFLVPAQPGSARQRAVKQVCVCVNHHISVTDRSWWNLARWRTLVHGTGSTVKILNFWKSKTSAAAILKNRDISAIVWPISTKFGMLMQNVTSPTVKEFEFHKSKMADGRHFENR